VRETGTPPRLADAADILSDQFRSHLERFAQVVSPHAAGLDRRFRGALRSMGLNEKQRMALVGITPGEAARLLAAGFPPTHFFEQVEYHGRRLAKFNLSPGDIAGALAAYDEMLMSTLEASGAGNAANLRWVRDQLHFCVVLTLNNAFYQVRETETQAFYELSRVELESTNLDDLLRRFLDSLLKFCRADEARLFLHEEAGEAGWRARASAGKTAEWQPAGMAWNPEVKRKTLGKARCVAGAKVRQTALDLDWVERFASCWSVPLSSAGRTVGVMQFGFTRTYEWLPREQELLASAAERCMMAADKARLMEDLAAREEQIRRLGEHMLHVEEVERQRISRELHDETGQSMLCIRLQLEVLEQSCPESIPETRARLGQVREMTERTIVEIRRLIRALSPSVLEQFGLGAALRQLVTQFHLVHPARIRLQAHRLGALPKQLEIMVYRLVQECCNNIAKHSSATTVNIFLSSADGVLRLQVEDNGVGFQIEEALAKQNSFGLSGMRERVALLGGRFELYSRPAGRMGKALSHKAALGKAESGTTILIELPVPSEGAGESRTKAMLA
jgi:signal transduction histidine kinase